MKKRYCYIILLFFIAGFVACSKNDISADLPIVPVETLYGKWQMGYGDTITFANKNGLNIATFRTSPGALNPNKPRSDREFTFNNGRLGIKDTLSLDFRTFDTFAWTDLGKSFNISARDWFYFVATDLAVVTFTKLP